MGQGSDAPDFAGPRARGRGPRLPAAFTDELWSARPAPRRVPSRFAAEWERAREGKR
jgi:hypothetical protein